MHVEAQVVINGTRADTWRVITDIAHAAETISGIESIELLEQPASGLVGLRWRETRMYFGKPASVVKCISEATPGERYVTRAEEGRFVFLSSMHLSGVDGRVTLTSRHDTVPQGVLAMLQALPMRLFAGVIRKALLQDLADIKKGVENG